MADLYFADSANGGINNDVNDQGNWFTDSSCTLPAFTTPGGADNAHIAFGMATDTAFSSQPFSIHVLSGGSVGSVFNGVAQNNGYIANVTSGSSVVINQGTINAVDANGVVNLNDSGIIGNNYGIVVTNSGTITVRGTGGTTQTENEIADVPEGYTVDTLNVPITNVLGTVQNSISNIANVQSTGVVGTNAGVITTVQLGGSVSTNNGTITTNVGTCTINGEGGTVTNNNGTITTNNGSVMLNATGGVIVTNSSTGLVSDNLSTAIITTNNGSVQIGTITGGTGNLSALNATNLANHSAGTFVTLPSGGTTNWW